MTIVCSSTYVVTGAFFVGPADSIISITVSSSRSTFSSSVCTFALDLVLAVDAMFSSSLLSCEIMVWQLCCGLVCGWVIVQTVVVGSPIPPLVPLLVSRCMFRVLWLFSLLFAYCVIFEDGHLLFHYCCFLGCLGDVTFQCSYLHALCCD